MTVRLEFAALDEVDAVVTFLHDHWRADHVLVTDRRVLDRQHRDEAAGRYDVLCAWSGDELLGILGVIRTARYDPALAAGGDTAWLTTWRVRDDAPPGLGIALVRGVRDRLRPTWLGTVGLRPETLPMYRALRMRTGTLARGHVLDVRRSDFRLATVPEAALARARAVEAARRPSGGGPAVEVFGPGDGARFLARTDGLGLDGGDQVPTRTRRFVAARYLEDPFYAYAVRLHVVDASAALVVTRVCAHEDARAVRVVDVVGDPAALVHASDDLRALLTETDAEYVDALGADDVALALLGLTPTADEPGLDLPTRFEPFERGAGATHWALAGPEGRLVLGKGDADQDRPNLPGRTVVGA